MSNVLLVEDDRVLREMLSDLLTEMGHQVHSVESSERVTGSYLREARPELLITDLVLPGAWGDHLCEALASTRSEWGLRLILISDTDEEELADRARACRADGYSTKRSLLANPAQALRGLPAAHPAPASAPGMECEVPVELSGEGVGRHSGIICGLSVSGLRVETSVASAPGTRLDLRFSLGGHAVEISAQVLRVAGGSRPGHRRMALKVVEVSPAAQLTLQSYVRASLSTLAIPPEARPPDPEGERTAVTRPAAWQVTQGAPGARHGPVSVALATQEE